MGEQADYLVDQMIDDHFENADILESPTASTEEKLQAYEGLRPGGFVGFMSDQALAKRKADNDKEWIAFFGTPPPK